MTTLDKLLQHFSLTALPFDRAVPPDGLLRHTSFTEALERLRFAVDSRGPGLLVAAPGTGKSIVLDTLCTSLAPGDVRVIAALFDAIAQTIGRADAEKRPDERVLCLIVTDGEENSSRETTLEQVRTIIREREARGDWTFAYLGAAPDRWAAETGMSAGSSVAFCAAEPRASFRVASEATRRLRASPRASTKTFFDQDEHRKRGKTGRDRS